LKHRAGDAFCKCAVVLAIPAGVSVLATALVGGSEGLARLAGPGLGEDPFRGGAAFRVGDLDIPLGGHHRDRLAVAGQAAEVHELADILDPHDLAAFGEVLDDVGLLAQARGDGEDGLAVVGELPEPFQAAVGDLVAERDGVAEPADFLGGGGLQKRCRVVGPPVAVHVMRDVVGMEGGEVGAVAAVGPLEEVEVDQRLEADLFPLAVGVPLPGQQARGGGEGGGWFQAEGH
jgi:hypothetical protein